MAPWSMKAPRRSPGRSRAGGRSNEDVPGTLTAHSVEGSADDDAGLPFHSGPYEEVIVMTALYAVGIPLLFVLPLALVFLDPNGGTLPHAGLFVATISVLLILFGRLHVLCDRNGMAFGFGPFRRRLPLTEIVAIQEVAVRPLSDHLGYGYRFGRDGSRGYIAAGNVGVRVDTRDGRSYVITVRDPRALVSCARSAMGTGRP
ncbi:MAG: hypothetical protein L0Z54_02685 [Thermoplasmata archaeon]|nr:hypothetical protein [Thermoplasmata archaeon]